MTKQEWISFWTAQKFLDRGTDPQVIQFIAGFLYDTKSNGSAVLQDVFLSGYCYYFAVMLKTAFGRGTVCQTYPSSHMVWVDDNGIAYDVQGVVTNYQKLVPTDNYGDAIIPFLRIPGKVSPDAMTQYIIVENIIKEQNL